MRSSTTASCELVSAFCGPLPMIVIADQLGVPRSDLPLFNKWSDAFVAQLSRMASPDEELEAVKLIVEYQHYFAKKLEERKRDRKDDIISDIVHARLEGERPLDTAESLSIIQQLLVAGNETTTSAIAEGILLLIQHPDQLALLQNDPGLDPESRRGSAAAVDANGQHVARLQAGHRGERHEDSRRQHDSDPVLVGRSRRARLRARRRHST